MPRKLLFGSLIVLLLTGVFALVQAATSGTPATPTAPAAKAPAEKTPTATAPAVKAPTPALKVPTGFKALEGTSAEPYSKTGWAAQIVHEASGMDLVFIPAGEFLMGSPPGEGGVRSTEVQHRVTISKPFYMGRFEVTQEQWKTVMGMTLAEHRDKNVPPNRYGPESLYGEGPRFPMYYLSWNDCQAFCAKAGVRLPTEAEWEYACRAGTQTTWCCAEKDVPAYAWTNENSKGNTHEVGTKKPNAWGLCDMHGNVWEWCADWLAPYAAAAQVDPKGPATGEGRVVRGGNCYFGMGESRSARRYGRPPDHRWAWTGFRVVLNLK
jgi:formylglycine-generating enzyme required for sulfatase activity